MSLIIQFSANFINPHIRTLAHPHINPYFCAVKNGIPYLSSPTHFTESTTAKPANPHFFKIFSE